MFPELCACSCCNNVIRLSKSLSNISAKTSHLMQKINSPFNWVYGKIISFTRCEIVPEMNFALIHDRILTATYDCVDLI